MTTGPSPAKKLLSVITPVYNEEGTVERCHSEVRRVMESLSERYDWEHVFADNHSEDETLSLLRKIAADDPHVRVLAYSRNFGAEKSSFTALRYTRGAAVVSISADLQEPPSLIPDMVDLWEAGNKVVYGTYKNPHESFITRALRWMYYRIVAKLSPDPLPHDFTGFALMDRRVVNEVTTVDDFAPYIRGLIATVGFKQIAIKYDRASRVAGHSKHGFAFLFDFGINGIISHSLVPIRLATITGMFLSITALLLSVAYVVMKLLVWNFQAPGATTVVVLILFFFGIQFFFFGILGEYIGAIHAQVRRKPFVIVEEKINFDEPRE